LTRARGYQYFILMSPNRKLLSLLFLFLAVCTAWPESSSLTYLNNILRGNELSADKSIQRLSTGTRLLVDDPANYALYEKLEGLIRSLDKEIENTTDMIYYYQYVESVLGTCIEVMQRVRELAVMKGNTVFSADDDYAIDAEINSQYDQIRFTLETADFNRKPVFSALFKDSVFNDYFKKSGYSLLSNIDRMITFFITQRSVYGAVTNRLSAWERGMSQQAENETGMQSTILDLDYAREMTELKRSQLLILTNLLLL
jgi:flagellin-like hook-associated protein FlgL